MLTAIKLAKHADVVGISAKPGLVSGQELGWRLARPDEWARHNWVPFGRFRGLDRVRAVHGTLTGVDLDSRTVSVTETDGATAFGYDVLVIATGVTNGFWRRPTLQTTDQRRPARPARAPGRRTFGDRRRRGRRGGEQCRPDRHHLADQAC